MTANKENLSGETEMRCQDANVAETEVNGDKKIIAAAATEVEDKKMSMG